MPVTIPKGATIAVAIEWKNIGPFTIPDTQWRLGIGRGGPWSPIITPWIHSGPIDPGVSIGMAPQGAIAGDWGEGELITVKLDAEVLNYDGSYLDGQKPLLVWEGYFVVVVPSLDWIQIVSAAPYVV